jgi:alanine racemase
MNVISIDKKTIFRNYDILHKLHPHDAIFPILKSNAYGHGLKQMVKILRKTDAPFFAVDSFPEYQIVKKFSNKDILLL